MSAVATSRTSVGRLTQRRVALSEWTKLRSVRSTRWSLLATLLLIMGLGIIACLVFESRWPHLSANDRRHFHPLRANLAGVNFAQLSIGVLGVLVMTAEYSTGMIRSTFSAVPKRLPVLWGKTLVFGAVAFVVSLPAVFIVFFVGQAMGLPLHESLLFLLLGFHSCVNSSTVDTPSCLARVSTAALSLAWARGILSLAVKERVAPSCWNRQMPN